MLHVLCHVGRDVYAIPSTAVERVLPFALLKALPGAPRGLVGLLNYQGESVPTVDLCLLLADRPARVVFGTRILLCPVAGLLSGRLALIVEEVSQVKNFQDSDFAPAGAQGDPCVTEVTASDEQLVQRIDVASILPAEVIAALDLSHDFAG